MKRILAFVLVFVVVFSVSSAFAYRHIYAHYSLFIDGEFYDSFFKAGFKYDTLMYDFYLYDDFSGGLISKEEWDKGVRTSSGLMSVVYTNLGSDAFKLTFSDGTFFLGYWDSDNDEDIWLNLGGNLYYRFTPVHSFDIQNDMVEK